jgi:hypothetical protein
MAIRTTKAAQSKKKRKKKKPVPPSFSLYAELGKLAGLITVISTAIIGQAELIGEPWRHYVTVIAVITTTVWAYCMSPRSLKNLVNRKGG